MCDQAIKHSANQVQANSSTSYPITTPQSPGLRTTSDSEFTVSLDGTQPANEDPSPSGMEGGQKGDTLPGPQSCMPHHMDRRAGYN